MAHRGAGRLVRDIDTPVRFSPSGDRIAFGRANNPEAGKVAIIVASADGGNERVLLTAPITAAYTSPPSWSPDSRSIAYTETFLKDTLGRLSVADVETGRTRVVFSTNAMTLADGSDPTPLVDSGRIFSPVCSPDGQWVVFNEPPTASPRLPGSLKDRGYR